MDTRAGPRDRPTIQRTPRLDPGRRRGSSRRGESGCGGPRSTRGDDHMRYRPPGDRVPALGDGLSEPSALGVVLPNVSCTFGKRRAVLQMEQVPRSMTRPRGRLDPRTGSAGTARQERCRSSGAQAARPPARPSRRAPDPRPVRLAAYPRGSTRSTRAGGRTHRRWPRMPGLDAACPDWRCDWATESPLRAARSRNVHPRRRRSRRMTSPRCPPTRAT